MSTKKSIKNGKKFHISDNLRNLRRAKNITVKELHGATGIAENTLRKYETDFKVPYLPNMLKIAQYFGISLDFLLRWDTTSYPKSLYLLSLAEKFDQMDQAKRFQIESTANSLLGSKHATLDIEIRTDNLEIELTENIHKNIKLLREYRGIRQRQVAEYLGITTSQVSWYEKNHPPPGIKLIKISEFLDISIHALVTGKKLNGNNIENAALRKTILKADKLLPLQEKNILIHLMKRIIEDPTS